MRCSVCCCVEENFWPEVQVVEVDAEASPFSFSIAGRGARRGTSTQS